MAAPKYVLFKFYNTYLLIHKFSLGVFTLSAFTTVISIISPLTLVVIWRFVLLVSERS